MAEYTQQTALSKTMAARGLVNGRDPLRRSGRDLVFERQCSLLFVARIIPVISFW